MVVRKCNRNDRYICWLENVGLAMLSTLLRYHALFSTILFPSLNYASKLATDYSSYLLAFGWTIGNFFPFQLVGPAGCPCWKHFNSQTLSKEWCSLLDVWQCPSVRWAVQFPCTPCYCFLFWISFLKHHKCLDELLGWIGYSNSSYWPLEENVKDCF